MIATHLGMELNLVVGGYTGAAITSLPLNRGEGGRGRGRGRGGRGGDYQGVRRERGPRDEKREHGIPL